MQPGQLLRFRNRTWISLPSDDPNLLLLQPLGGSEEEITGVYLPLQLPNQRIEPDTFPLPALQHLGNFVTARWLFEAARLSFRQVAGPFRCMGKLSFRPRSYQMVPLVLALQQETTRLLLADDVGIGKTVEALMILKELLERGEIRRFAVVCPPHLCEQWQSELADKIDIHAPIVRSGTAAALDRTLPHEVSSIFAHLTAQVISIDYIKGDRRRELFLHDCPEFVIVDEAHTCARPAGATSPSQQQRFHLLHDLAADPRRHMLLLTATPHSGKNDEFQSLLGLLKPEFERFPIDSLSETQRRQLARHFIQRKRENILRWAGEDTAFPRRESSERAYTLSEAYRRVFDDTLAFARKLVAEPTGDARQRMRHWAALALLRGVMSSPAAGEDMLRRRLDKALAELDAETVAAAGRNILDQAPQDPDEAPAEWLDLAGIDHEDVQDLAALLANVSALRHESHDAKAATALKMLRTWVAEGFMPIVFCRFIATARYLGEWLRTQLPKDVQVEVLTSETPDEQRREAITALDRHPKRLLVATDCLSEGINLQHSFTAVLHYDLPWNPNRLEQREGRVDRFGQDAPVVRSAVLWGSDNLIDATVLKILIQKVREIQRTTGVSLPLAEDHQGIMDAVLDKVLFQAKDDTSGRQMALFEEEFVTRQLEEAKERALRLRSIFAHSSVSQEDIEAQLEEVDEAIGDVGSVERFTLGALAHLGADAQPKGRGYVFSPVNLPPGLRYFFQDKEQQVQVSFASPTPKGFRYLGRNHRFTEALCRFMLSVAMDPHPDFPSIARAAVIRTTSVSRRTVLVLLRIRAVARERGGSQRQSVAEEMILWAQEQGETPRLLAHAEAKRLLLEAQPSGNLSAEFQQKSLQSALDLLPDWQELFLDAARARADHLVEAHARYRALAGGRQYETVSPILPPDVLGVYVLLPG
ncbi:MAG: helicase-related protein [Bacteroidia bacterium]|nr:helicase-related protein [Bacteroidia bacterium]